MAAIASLCAAAGCGFLNTLSVNAVAYPTHLEAANGQRFSERQKKGFVALNVFFSLSGAACFFLALKWAPVSMVMPVSNASTLLSNMLLQMGLGIKLYSKSMRVGTLVLVCAVCVLIDVGPRDRNDLSPELLLTPSGAACSGVLLAILAVRRTGLCYHSYSCGI